MNPDKQMISVCKNICFSLSYYDDYFWFNAWFTGKRIVWKY